jgi:hypothetical protein
VTEAKAQLSELIRRAEVGDQVTYPAWPRNRASGAVKAASDRKSRRALLEAMRETASAKVAAGPGAARNQDFLYGDDGLAR